MKIKKKKKKKRERERKRDQERPRERKESEQNRVNNAGMVELIAQHMLTHTFTQTHLFQRQSQHKYININKSQQTIPPDTINSNNSNNNNFKSKLKKLKQNKK